MRVMVVCTTAGGPLPSVGLELIGGARRLVTGRGGTVTAAVIGSGVESASRDAAAHGADEVIAMDHPALAEFDSALYLQALEIIARDSPPAAILLSADSMGAELGPRLAHRLGTGTVTECTGVRLDQEGKFIFTRPVYGGHLTAEMSVLQSPCVATLLAGGLEPLPRDDSRAVEVRTVQVPLEESARRTRVLEVQGGETGAIPLEGAKVVVSGGKGLGDAASFRYVQELAEVLGAAVGASRAAVDQGWVPATLQVGQTGKKVAPDLYIAVGISGATQHVAGMQRARHTVVINIDAEAPFYRMADLGVAIDYKQFLPLLTRKLKTLLLTG